MRAAVRAIVIILVSVAAIWAAVGSVRWAKRQSTGAQLLASAMLLVLGIGAPVVNPPQQGIEEAREDKNQKGGHEAGETSRRKVIGL